MKLAIFLLLFFSLLFIINFKSAHTPFWSQNSTSAPSNLQYSPGKNYGFEINWTDSELGFGGVSKVLFETDFSGTLINYTSYTTPAVNNNTVGIYWINFTDLKVGTYVFKWYANDTNNNFNFTNQWIYLIAKNTSGYLSLTLNGTEGNRSYNQNENANFTVYLNLAGKTVYLNSNYPNWALQSNSTSVIYNITNLSSLGLFNLTAYWNGDENYSESSKTYFFDNIVPQYSNNLTYPTSPAIYYPNQNYQFNISWSDATLSKVWFESNHTGSFVNYTSSSNPAVQNSSGIFWINLTDLASKVFAYRWFANDTLNKVNYTNQTIYNVTKGSALVLEISPSSSVNQGTETTVWCYSNTNQVTVDNFKLYRDSTLIANTSLLMRKDISTLSIGTYNYTCNNTATQNYTNQTLTRTLTVSAPSIPPTGGEFKITNVPSPEINIGEIKEASFNLTNTLGQTLNNITISLDGISSNWYTIESPPESISSGSSLIIFIKFNIPTNAEANTYTITITVSGKTATNETKTATQTMYLKISAPSPTANLAPSFSENSINNTKAGKLALFSLKWGDDSGLSGYIFSTNNSGTWENDSWIPMSGTEDWSNVTKILNSTIGLTIGWKVYANDSNDVWSVSEEYSFKTTGMEIDFLTPLIWLSIILIIAVFAFIIYKLIKMKLAKPAEEEVIYVYSREEAEKISELEETYVYTEEEVEESRK